MCMYLSLQTRIISLSQFILNSSNLLKYTMIFFMYLEF